MDTLRTSRPSTTCMPVGMHLGRCGICASAGGYARVWKDQTETTSGSCSCHWGAVEANPCTANLSVITSGAGPLRALSWRSLPTDIEIGCGGTILKFAAAGRRVEVHWIVFSSTPERELELVTVRWHSLARFWRKQLSSMRSEMVIYRILVERRKTALNR